MGQAFNKLVGKDGSGHGEGLSREAAVAKTAGFFVFSGIAMSILKALSPFNGNNNKLLTHSVTEQSQPTDPSHSHSRESIFKGKKTRTEQDIWDSRQKTVDIVSGDTLWGLSRKYGVSIDAIKEANGLTGDTIYAACGCGTLSTYMPSDVDKLEETWRILCGLRTGASLPWCVFNYHRHATYVVAMKAAIHGQPSSRKQPGIGGG